MNATNTRTTTPEAAGTAQTTAAPSTCCGGPAPAGTDACCVKDADAKKAGADGLRMRVRGPGPRRPRSFTLASLNGCRRRHRRQHPGRPQQQGAEHDEERHEGIAGTIDQSERPDPDVEHADEEGGKSARPSPCRRRVQAQTSVTPNVSMHPLRKYQTT